MLAHERKLDSLSKPRYTNLDEPNAPIHTPMQLWCTGRVGALHCQARKDSTMSLHSRDLCGKFSTMHGIAPLWCYIGHHAMRMVFFKGADMVVQIMHYKPCLAYDRAFAIEFS